MAYCGNCGNELANDVKFCPNCGTASDAYSEAAAAVNVEQKKVADGIINANFGKALASAICASFPIASIVAIFLGCGALKQWKAAIALSQQYGFKLTGKNIPVRVLGLVGKIAGIAMTIFWSVYFILMICLVVFSVVSM